MAFGDNDAVAFGLDDEEEGAPKGASFMEAALREAKNVGTGALGTAAAAGDILGGALKFPASRLAAVATKLRNPSYNWDELRNAADAATEEKFPSLGRTLGVDQSSGYTAPMKPFELLSEGVNKLGDIYGDVTGGGAEAAGGAKMALDVGMMAGIPGLKTAGKVARKGIEVLDPGIRNAGKTSSNARSVRDVVEEQKLRNEQPQGTLFGTEDGVLSESLPAKITDQYGELAKTKQAEELAGVARETELPRGEQMDLFGEELLPHETNPAGQLARAPEQIPMDLSFGKDTPATPLETPKTASVESSAPQIFTGKSALFEGYGASIGSLSEGNRKQLMVDANGKYYWGDWMQTSERDVGAVAGGADAQGTPASFPTAKEARAAAASVTAEAPKAPPRDVPPTPIKSKDGTEYTVSVTKQTFGVNESKPNSVMVEVRDPVSGERRGMVDFAIREDGVLVAENAKVAPSYKGQGIAEQMYKAARDAGYDIAPGRVQTDAGNAMVAALQRKGLINKESDVPRFNAGDLDIVPIEGESIPGEAFMPKTTMGGPLDLIPMAERIPLPDTLELPRSPETIAARQKERVQARILGKVAPEAALKEWLDVNTMEEAYALSLDHGKDIGSGTIGRNLASGIQGVTIMSGHPMLRYFRKHFGDARGEIARLSQELITNRKDGFAKAIQDVRPKEAVAVVELMNEADRRQVRITPEMMAELGFNRRQRELVESFVKAADKILEVWNDKRKQLGLKPVRQREGWFPGVMKGSYKTLVMDKDGHPIGFIGQDTKMQQRAAKAHYKKNYPGAVFGTMTHQGLGRANKVDAFSGINDILAIVAENDPVMKRILEESQEANKLINNRLFSVGKHELEKKGISGNEGNKPWLSKERNAKEALQAAVEYFEAAIEHHALQIPLHDAHKVITDPAFPHENVKKYLQDYSNHVSGKTGRIGEAINSAIDSVFDAVGVGSSIPLNVANNIKAGMSRMFMGFNPAFLASQGAQPFQLAFPLAGTFATRLGMPQHMVANAMGRGAAWFMSEQFSSLIGKPELSIAPAYVKDAIKYAEQRGLHAFNDLELAHQATRGKVRRGFGKVADFTISAGDRMTKMPTYLGMVEIFKDAGIDNLTAFQLAEKATESSMVNYHPWERPIGYQKLGVVGQFAGGLTTYKHASMNLQAKLVQEAFGEQKNFKPLVMSLAAMVAFAGITGIAGYAEFDFLYSKLHELAKGKPSSIREDVLTNLPEYVKSGVISAASNLNMQAKWSAADMVPDSAGKALSPHLEAAYKIAEAAVVYAHQPDTVNKANLLMALTPSGLKGYTEEAVRKDEQGRVLDNKGLPVSDQPRSANDWAKRKYAGVGLLSESVENTDLYKDKTSQMYIEKQIADKSKAVKQAFIGSDFPRMNKLYTEYVELAGPEAGQALLQELGSKTQLDKYKGARQRAQGTPNNLRGVQKYNEYNDDK